MSTELRLRIISGIVMAAVVLAATWYGGLLFQALSVAIALLVYYEWSTITGLVHKDPAGNAFAWLAQVVVGGLVLMADFETAVAVLVGAVMLGLVWSAVAGKSGWLAGGILYAGLTGISMAAIRGDNAAGLIAMLFVFAVVWGTDILAYFVGRAIGGPKLAPRISPGKTWSGAIGGTVAGVICGVAVFLANFSLDGLLIPLFALLLSIASQVGDLFESFIKRRFGVKDSSRLIPGHGGVMDRVDGLVFACFAAFLIAVADAMAGGSASPGAVLLGL